MMLFSLTTVLSLLNAAFALSECGLSPIPDDELTGKVVGGRDALRGQWPWQVSMWNVYNGNPEYHFCGGTIINDKWVMTAAHCLGGNHENMILRFNKYNLTAKERNEVNRGITKVFVHPGWSWATGENDIGLVKMNTSLELDNKNNKLTPVCIHRKNVPLKGKKCLAIGWGLLEYKGETPEVLQEVGMPIIEDEVCKRSYQRLRNVTDKMICAGHMEGAKGVCHGDSGGPLQCLLDDGKWYEVGITSWGVGCAWEHFPGVFARVTQYVDWIDDIVASN